MIKIKFSGAAQSIARDSVQFVNCAIFTQQLYTTSRFLQGVLFRRFRACGCRRRLGVGVSDEIPQTDLEQILRLLLAFAFLQSTGS